jgi:O-antigen/teichoic acid export membrane protein
MIILYVFYFLSSYHLQFNSYGKEFLLLLFTYGILAIAVPAYYFSLGLGKVKLLSKLNTLSAAVGTLSLYFFIKEYGLLGAAFSRLLYSSMVLLTLLIPHQIFKDDSNK